MNEDKLIRTNIVLTKVLRKALKAEANQRFGGKVSMVLREILGKRYKLPYLLPHEIQEKK